MSALIAGRSAAVARRRPGGPDAVSGEAGTSRPYKPAGPATVTPSRPGPDRPVSAPSGGDLPAPPTPGVDAPPAAQPSASASGGSLPRSSPASRPALKQSPAPVASTGDTGGGGARYWPLPSA